MPQNVNINADVNGTNSRTLDGTRESLILSYILSNTDCTTKQSFYVYIGRNSVSRVDTSSLNIDFYTY